MDNYYQGAFFMSALVILALNGYNLFRGEGVLGGELRMLLSLNAILSILPLTNIGKFQRAKQKKG